MQFFYLVSDDSHADRPRGAKVVSMTAKKSSLLCQSNELYPTPSCSNIHCIQCVHSFFKTSLVFLLDEGWHTSRSQMLEDLAGTARLLDPSTSAPDERWKSTKSQ